MPWLDLLPAEILGRLCLDEFVLPKPTSLSRIRRLERELGCYIMPYSLVIFRMDLPAERHLCANVGQAVLSPSGLGRLLALEASLKSEGISLAAYEKPLRVVVPAVFPNESAV